MRRPSRLWRFIEARERSPTRRVLEARNGAGHGRVDARPRPCALLARRTRSGRACRASVVSRSSRRCRTRCCLGYIADACHVRQDGPGICDGLLPLVLLDPAVRSSRAIDRRRPDLLFASQARQLGRRHRAFRSARHGGIRALLSQSRDDPRDVRRLPRRCGDRSRPRCARCRSARDVPVARAMG